jgi:Flp pilus assembly protein TadG
MTRPPQQRNRRGRARRGERAQAVAELAMLLPIFLILLIGVIEVNNALNAHITIVSASRDGARLGSKGAATDNEMKALVQKDMERLPNTVDTTDITITYPTVDGVTSVKVEACYDHTTLLQVPVVMPNAFRMCAQTTMPKLN